MVSWVNMRLVPLKALRIQLQGKEFITATMCVERGDEGLGHVLSPLTSPQLSSLPSLLSPLLASFTRLLIQDQLKQNERRENRKRMKKKITLMNTSREERLLKTRLVLKKKKGTTTELFFTRDKSFCKVSTIPRQEIPRLFYLCLKRHSLKVFESFKWVRLCWRIEDFLTSTLSLPSHGFMFFLASFFPSFLSFF